MRPLREWQQAALSKYQQDGYPTDWLVTATPGAGKTTFALALARDLWDQGRVRRVIVVTPTDHLRTQWVAAAQQSGFDLRATPNAERLPTDAAGVVATYAQVAAGTHVFDARCRTRATLVIFDEMHHAGDDKSWGTAVIDAFDSAKHRVGVTGTPFRTDRSRIPHVRYERAPGEVMTSVADFTYGYSEALADGVVRPVVFAAYSGNATWRNSAGDVLTAMLGDPSVSTDDEEQAWKTALDPGGQWIAHVFAAAHTRVCELRAGRVRDAAVLVLASNQAQAREYATVWQAVTGETPVVILSDDADASNRISEFRDNPAVTCAVSVRMVSEGVDVPRAAVLVFACTASTPLFFAQAVGRVVRSRRRGEPATVFIPAVGRLLALAAEMERERNHIIPVRLSGLDPVMDVPDEAAPAMDDLPPGDDVPAWEPISSNAAFNQVIASAAPVPPDDDGFLGLPGLLTPEQEAALLARRDADAAERARKAAARQKVSAEAAEVARRAALVHAQSSGRAVQPPTRAGDDEAGQLRRKIAAAVRVYAAAKGLTHTDAWSRLYARTPGPKNNAAPVDLLRHRLSVINTM